MTEIDKLIEQDNENLLTMNRIERAEELVRKAILTVEESDNAECRAIADVLGIIQKAMQRTVSLMHQETAEIEEKLEGMRDER